MNYVEYQGRTGVINFINGTTGRASKTLQNDYSIHKIFYLVPNIIINQIYENATVGIIGSYNTTLTIDSSRVSFPNGVVPTSGKLANQWIDFINLVL